MTESDETDIWAKPYWKPPITKDKGDDDGKQIRTAVGSALSNWEYVEEEVSELFMILTECNGSLAVRRAFGAIESGGVRRNALGAAAQVYFRNHPNREAAEKRFTKVVEAIGRASRLRDNIAHGTVIDSISVRDGSRMMYSNPGFGMSMRAVGPEVEIFGAFLVPAGYNSLRNLLPHEQNDESPLGFLRGIYRYTSGDILIISYKFHALRYHLGEYFEEIRKPFKGEAPSPTT